MNVQEVTALVDYRDKLWNSPGRDKEVDIAVWYDVLSHVDAATVRAALKRLSESGREYPPGPAHIMGEMKKAVTGNIPSWQECKGTIEASFYDGTAIRDAHPIVRLVSAAVGGPRSLAANAYGADARVKAAYWPIVERYERDTANELSGSPQIASAPRSALGTRRGGEPAQIGISAPIRPTYEDALD